MAPLSKVISGNEDGSIKVWNLITGECLKTIKEHTKFINNIKLISFDTFSSCSDDKKIKLFDLNTFNCIKTFIGHEHEVCDIEKI